MPDKRLKKSELVAMFAEAADVPVVRAEKYLNTYLDIITETLSQGGSVQLSGFGTFHVKNRASRMGVNPRSLKKMKIKGRKLPAFKPGERLKNAVE